MYWLRRYCIFSGGVFYFEPPCRKMIRASWTQHTTNAPIFDELLEVVHNQKPKLCFGHIACVQNLTMHTFYGRSSSNKHNKYK